MHSEKRTGKGGARGGWAAERGNDAQGERVGGEKDVQRKGWAGRRMCRGKASAVSQRSFRICPVAHGKGESISCDSREPGGKGGHFLVVYGGLMAIEESSIALIRPVYVQHSATRSRRRQRRKGFLHRSSPAICE